MKKLAIIAVSTLWISGLISSLFSDAANRHRTRQSSSRKTRDRREDR